MLPGLCIGVSETLQSDVVMGGIPCLVVLFYISMILECRPLVIREQIAELAVRLPLLHVRLCLGVRDAFEWAHRHKAKDILVRHVGPRCSLIQTLRDGWRELVHPGGHFFLCLRRVGTVIVESTVQLREWE